MHTRFFNKPSTLIKASTALGSAMGFTAVWGKVNTEKKME